MTLPSAPETQRVFTLADFDFHLPPELIAQHPPAERSGSRLLDGRQPPGYGVQTRSHNAVAASVAQRRADWGIAIDTVAGQYGLGFIPLQEEHYDFVVPKARAERPSVKAFIALLRDPAARTRLQAMGLRL